MQNAAICFGRTILYWDSILIALAALACFFAVAAFYPAGRSKLSLCVFAPLALALAFGISRLMYWYCHMEQFSSLLSAYLTRSTGGYCLSGIVMGFALAVLLLRLVGLEKNSGLLFDCAAPGLALGLAVLRLSSLFNNSCRGKALINDPRFQRLPYAYRSVTASGIVEYRFAAFFVEALLFLLFFVLLTWLFGRFRGEQRRRRAKDGDVFLYFLLLYSAAELVMDSTRNDASFFHVNAFISVAQILSAVTILAVLICFSVRSVRRHGLRVFHWLCWLAYLLGLGGAGVCEYLVQRHGDWQLTCYSLMSLACLVMIGAAAALHGKRLRTRAE